jgi:hypothetical protein
MDLEMSEPKIDLLCPKCMEKLWEWFAVGDRYSNDNPARLFCLNTDCELYHLVGEGDTHEQAWEDLKRKSEGK